MSENMKITSFFFTASAGDIRGLPQMYEEYVTMTNISFYSFRISTTDTPQRGVSVDSCLYYNALCVKTDTYG